MPIHSISCVTNVTYRDEEGMYFKYYKDRETSALMVRHRETQRHYRITNKSRLLDFKEERASSALFIPSLWYNSRFLLSFACKRRVVKLISRYSTYTAPHLSTSLVLAFIISPDFAPLAPPRPAALLILFFSSLPSCTVRLVSLSSCRT